MFVFCGIVGQPQIGHREGPVRLRLIGELPIVDQCLGFEKREDPRGETAKAGRPAIRADAVVAGLKLLL